jgi:hypothetical protein
MRAARLRHWLDAKDPGLVAVKRALRVTLVACAAFYFSLYLLHDSQMAAANDLESTVRSLTHREVPSSDRHYNSTVAVHLLALTDSTYAQYRSELRSAPDPVDWLGVLGLAHEVVRGGQALRRTHGTAGPLPWRGVADELAELGSATAEQLRAIGGLLNTEIRGSNASSETAYVVVDSWISTSDGREVVRRRTDPVAAVRVLDLWGWLTGVAFDSRRVADGARAAAKS